MLQKQLIVKHPDIIIYAVNDLYIYSSNNLESLKDEFMYENLEMVRESDGFLEQRRELIVTLIFIST